MDLSIPFIQLDDSILYSEFILIFDKTECIGRDAFWLSLIVFIGWIFSVTFNLCFFAISKIHFAKKYENEKLKFQHTGMKDLINKNIKYDFISSIEVIEHQYDPLQYIKEINEVTNKNGLILISTPFHGYFKNLLISILNLNDKHYGVLWKHGHIKFFSVKSLKKLIEVSNCPIKIEDIKFSGRIYPFSNSMIFLLRKY